MEENTIELLNEIRCLCDPMDAKFDKIKAVCDNAMTRLMKSRSDSTQKYEKFMVLYNKKGNPPNAVPWTGLEQTIDFIREKLEDGYVVQVKPFTREEWGNG